MIRKLDLKYGFLGNAQLVAMVINPIKGIQLARVNRPPVVHRSAHSPALNVRHGLANHPTAHAGI